MTTCTKCNCNTTGEATWPGDKGQVCQECWESICGELFAEAHNQIAFGKLQDENKRLRIALHDAINRPKGVVPESAAYFYDQSWWSEESRKAKAKAKPWARTRK